MSTSSERGGYSGPVRRVDVIDVITQHTVERAVCKPWGPSEHREFRESREMLRGAELLSASLAADSACFAVANSISLRQSATETKTQFVRRIVGAWLAEVSA